MRNVSMMVLHVSLVGLLAACGDDGEGAGGEGGGSSTSTTTTTGSTTTSTSSSGGEGGGDTCVGELDVDDEEWVSCLSASCCEAVEACTDGGAAQQDCVDCLVRGSGDPRCNDLIVCSLENGCGPFAPICDAAMGTLPEVAACSSESCCEEANACTEGGTDPSGCLGCINDGGGARCDALLACQAAECDFVFAPICDSGVGTGNEDFSACLSESCCEELNACTTEGTTVDACIDCINGGGGALCDAALACAAECDGGAPICDSGLSSPGTPEGETYAACASENCCDEFNACTEDGADPEGCIECFESGGGERCDPVLVCVSRNQCDPTVAWFCNAGIGFAQPGPAEDDAAACITESCCEEANACTSDGADVEACAECLGGGGGELCDPLNECAITACERALIVFPICDSGLQVGDEDLAACASESCCDEHTACAGDTPEEAQACVDCILAGGGEACDEVIACMNASCDLGGGGGGAGGGGGMGGAGG